VTDQQRFIDALRDVLGMAPLYHADAPKPERFWNAAPFYEGCRRVQRMGATADTARADRRFKTDRGFTRHAGRYVAVSR